jgi:hypothetical protein
MRDRFLQSQLLRPARHDYQQQAACDGRCEENDN